MWKRLLERGPFVSILSFLLFYGLVGNHHGRCVSLLNGFPMDDDPRTGIPAKIHAATTNFDYDRDGQTDIIVTSGFYLFGGGEPGLLYAISGSGEIKMRWVASQGLP